MSHQRDSGPKSPFVLTCSDDSRGNMYFKLQDGQLTLINHFLDAESGYQLMQKLIDTLAWEQSEIQMFGRQVLIPRLNAWYGDPGCHYRYSGKRFAASPWTDELLHLKNACDDATGQQFNSVLANWYRNGDDSMGWHSDDEKELGPEPTIAAVSLGACRQFYLRHKQDNTSSHKLRLWLPHGSLLIMSGALQQHWKHSLPRSKKVADGRLSLTFRRVVSV